MFWGFPRCVPAGHSGRAVVGGGHRWGKFSKCYTSAALVGLLGLCGACFGMGRAGGHLYCLDLICVPDPAPSHTVSMWRGM